MASKFLNSTTALSSETPVLNFAHLPELMRPAVLASEIDTTVQRLAKDRVAGGGIPFVRWGRSVYYRRCDVEEFFASRLRRSTSECGLVAAGGA